VPGWCGEFVGLADIEQHDRIAGCEPALQFLGLDPGRLLRAKPAKQPGQERDHGKHSQTEESIAQGRGIADSGRSAGI